MYPRCSRLRTSQEWHGVRRRGRCVTSTLTSFWVTPGTDHDRFGFSTTKGFGGAVKRNRARRRLREAFRSVYGGTATPVSLVGVAKPSSRDVDYEELCAHIAEQLTALGLPTSLENAEER